MASNDNSVNMDRRYHHGDLRAALIEAGLRLLETRAADDLSLREVARAVGVSATSVYRHFPDKAALLAALAADGLERLGAAQRQAALAAGGGAAGFAATGRAYVRFALANPALFRMIFTSAPPSADHIDGTDAMAFLRANAAQAAGVAPDSRAAEVRSIWAWSLVHGLAMLMLDGQVPADESLVDEVVALS